MQHAQRVLCGTITTASLTTVVAAVLREPCGSLLFNMNSSGFLGIAIDTTVGYASV